VKKERKNPFHLPIESFLFLSKRKAQGERAKNVIIFASRGFKPTSVFHSPAQTTGNGDAPEFERLWGGGP
jgi:hypothetical protein